MNIHYAYAALAIESLPMLYYAHSQTGIVEHFLLHKHSTFVLSLKFLARLVYVIHWINSDKN